MAFSLNRSQYIIAGGVITIVAGFMAIIGWQFDITQLKSLARDITPINPVTATTFIISGAWLILYQKRRFQKLQLLFLCIVMAVGVIHFTTYFFPVNGIRIDYLLYGEEIKNAHIPNLIAPNTSFVFMLSGISMLTASTKRKWMLILRQALIMIGFAIVYISILGYIYNIEPAYRFGGFTPMALFSALIFLVLNASLFLTNTEYGLPKTFASSLNGSRLLRKVFVFLITLPPLIGYLRLLGEQKGLYSTEFGVELYTLVFSLVVFIFIIMYASLENKKQLANIRSEKQLANNEQRFRILFNSLKEGVASIDYNGKITYCNPSYCAILGYSEAELMGQKVVDMIIPLGRRKEFYERLEARKNGKEEDYETEIIKKTGEKIWIDIKSRTLLDNDNNAYAYIVSVNDITEDKLKIEDLKAFSGSAAHDLNAPLSRIIMAIEAFNKNDLDEEQKMLLSMIEKTSFSMLGLLNDLLNFSKLGAAQLEKTEINLDKIVHEICAVQTPPNFIGQVIIRALPPTIGNEAAIRQLFTNLISNAIKYSSKKDTPRIEIGAYQKNGETVYYVKDNGVGLTEEQAKALFTPFKRFHNDFEGNGLGLAIVKRVVEKHSGNIWAESREENGLTFHLTLSPDLNSENHLDAKQIG